MMRHSGIILLAILTATLTPKGQHVKAATPAGRLPVSPIGGRTIALFSVGHKTYVTAENAGNASLNAARNHIGPWQSFGIHDLGDNTVALQARANNRFVSAEQAGNQPLIANRTSVGDWEKFRIIQPFVTRFDLFALQSLANGKFVRVPDGNGGALVADRDTVGDHELFNMNWTDRLIGFNKYHGCQIALHCPALKRYVSAENAGTAPLNASREAINGPWEKFLIEDLGDGTVALKADANGKFVSAEQAGSQPLIANRTSVGDWEKFRIVHLQDSLFALQSLANGKYVRVPDGNGGALVADRDTIGEHELLNVCWLDIDLWRAFNAFALNFPGKVKEHTLGRLEYARDGFPADRGVLFITEKVIDNKLWQYQAFPKSDVGQFPDGYQHVWDGILLEGDGYISADCTVPFGQQGAHWVPAIPRVHRTQPIGVEIRTKTVQVTSTQIDLNNNHIPGQTEQRDDFGTIYPPILANLSDPASEENVGWRWILEFGYLNSPERYALDLGPEVGIFSPRYGLLGYHEAETPDDKRYGAKIKSKTINLHRRFNGTPQQ